jgi:hypothetical protein
VRLDVARQFESYPPGNSFFVFSDTTLIYDNSTTQKSNYYAAAGAEWSPYEKRCSFYVGAQIFGGYAQTQSQLTTTPGLVPTEWYYYFPKPPGTHVEHSDSTYAASIEPIIAREIRKDYNIGIAVPVGFRLNLGRRFELGVQVYAMMYSQTTKYFQTDVNGDEKTKTNNSFNFDTKMVQLMAGYKF